MPLPTRARSRTPSRAARALLAFACGIAVVCTIAQPASAYIDPGTGSMLVQAVVAAVAGAALAAKAYWQRIRAFLGREPDGAAERDEPAQSESDDA